MDEKLIKSFNSKYLLIKDNLFVFCGGNYCHSKTYELLKKEIDNLKLIFDWFIEEEERFKDSIAEERGEAYLSILKENCEYKKAVHFLLALIDNEKLQKYPLNIKKIQQMSGL